MNFKINHQFTIFAQSQSALIEAVYTDDENEYIVEKHQIVENPPFKYRLVIKRSDGDACHSWRKFQEIKDAVAGDNVVAIEVYPIKSQVTDTANMYHLWVFEEGYGPNVSLTPPNT